MLDVYIEIKVKSSRINSLKIVNGKYKLNLKEEVK